jgi:transposase
LWKIEENFKISKSSLESRPVYVWTKEHIEAHFLTCFVSLVIMRLLETKLGSKYSNHKIIESLKKYSCIHSNENIFQFYYTDKIIKELESAFNIDLSNKLLTKKNIRKLLRY